MRIATWNINRAVGDRARRFVSLLDQLNCDIIALQEVVPTVYDLFIRSEFGECGYHAVSDCGQPREEDGRSGVALITRNGLRLAEPMLIPGLPKRERGLAATVLGASTSINVASWHAPHSGEGVGNKLQSYQAIIEWLRSVTGPIVLGFDGNHGYDDTPGYWPDVLDPPIVPDSDGRYRVENQFYGANNLHRLRDAFLEHLRNHPVEYQGILDERPHGPLAVSYKQRRPNKRRNNNCLERFDHLFISDELTVSSCRYHYDLAKTAGSDHGIVVAELELSS